MKRMMLRRDWLRQAGAGLSLLLCPPLFAGEATGRWDDQSKAEYCNKLIDWLKSNFQRRAELLGTHTGTPFKLNYDYLAPTEDRAKTRILEKFAAGRLSTRETQQHVEKCLTELEAIRAALAGAEDKAAASWNPEADEVLIREGKVYDTSISAGRLTVVLDSSNSMTRFLPALRAEIQRDFADAYIVEVNGCHLDRHSNVPWFFAAPARGINPFTADRHIPKVPELSSVKEAPYSAFIGWTRALPSALHCMADLMHADAIYWFCDFDDKDSKEVMRAIGRKIMEKKIKLFVHTVAKLPPPTIATLAEMSGGKVIRKRL